MRQQIEIDQAATLELIPTQGVPTAATIEVLDDDGEELVGEDTATIDSFSQTVTADASRDTRELTVASTSGLVVGRPYWLQTTGGRGYEIVPADTDSTTIYLTGGVRFDVTASQATVKGLRISATLDAADTSAEQRGAYAVWRYTVGGVVYAKRVRFDIVEWPFDIDVTEARVEEAESIFGEALGQYVPVSQLAAEARRAVWRQLKLHLVDKPDEDTPGAYHRDLLEDAMAWYILWLRHMEDENRRGLLFAEFEKAVKASLGRMMYRSSSS